MSPHQTLEAVIWLDQSIDTGFLDHTINALNTAEDQLNISIDITNAYSDYGRVDVEAPFYRDRPNIDDGMYSLRNEAPDHMEIQNDQQHFLLVDQPYPSSNQGWTWGTPGGPQGPWSEYNQVDASSSVSCVNAAAKLWAEGSNCYGGMGNMTFRATVMHNLGHGLLPSVPATGSNHQYGEILDQDSKPAVSPMQMGYIAAPCSGNDPPDSNCSNNPEAYVDAINNVYSDCAVSAIDSRTKL